RSIPKTLIEAAKLDNIKDGKIMTGIVFPLSRHAISSTGIWFFITTWNEYVWPVLILKKTENYTLPLALQNYISAEGGTNFTVAMSVSVVTMIVPLTLYLIFQKYIIGTFVSAGIK
ncbi:ABC transporter permease subunit, partial [Vagococcus salmoninarum]